MLSPRSSYSKGAASGGSLLDRIRRVVGQPVVASHTPRGTWLAGALVMLSIGVIVPIVMAVGDREAEEFLENLEKDVQGKFRLKDVPGGRYRFVAQSCPGTPSVLEIFEKNGKEITLRGVQNNVVVPSEEAKNLLIRNSLCYQNGDVAREQMAERDGYRRLRIA